MTTSEANTQHNSIMEKHIKKQKETPAYYDIIVYDIVDGSNGEGEDSICWL